MLVRNVLGGRASRPPTRREGVVRVARNELLKEILRDYRYIEHQGMGVRNRIIESMRRHNNTEPDLEEQDDRFVVRLWKANT